MNTRILKSLVELDRSEWDRLFGEASEGYDYFLACEQAPPPNFRFYAMVVFDGEQVVAGAPLFHLSLQLDRLFEGALRNFLAGLNRLWPGGLSIPVIGAGSPHADELPLVFAPGLTEQQRERALRAFCEGLMTHARDSRAQALLFKNLTPQQRQWMDAGLTQSGYAGIAALPNAKLPVAESDEAYIQSLSANMRSNIRRKIKRSAAIRTEIREDIGAVEQQVRELREATKSRAKADYGDFAEVSPDYYRAVMSRTGSGARLLLYWLDEHLVGFAIALSTPGKLKEKYTGLRYPEALEHGVFFLNWMNMLRLGRETGVAEFHSGETTYLTKQRLGCVFERSWIYLRHRNALINVFLRRLAPLLAFDKSDPDLRELGDKAPYRD